MSSKVVMGSLAPQETSKNPIKRAMKTCRSQTTAVTQRDACLITTHTCLIISCSVHTKNVVCYSSVQESWVQQGARGPKQGTMRTEERGEDKLFFSCAFKQENKESLFRARASVGSRQQDRRRDVVLSEGQEVATSSTFLFSASTSRQDWIKCI